MGLQVIQAGLAAYAVPLTDYEHHWGLSANQANPVIDYLGRPVRRDEALAENRRRFVEKWAGLLEGLAGRGRPG